MNTQGGKRDILSQRKSTTDQFEYGLGGDAETRSNKAMTGPPTYDLPPAGVSKSQKDMNRFYQTANNLYGKDKGLNKFVQEGMHNSDDVRTIIGLALNRKQVSSGYHSQAYPYFMRS